MLSVAFAGRRGPSGDPKHQRGKETLEGYRVATKGCHSVLADIK